MTQTSDFDALYASSWRPLLLQTFAVCGDLDTARTALQRSFVDAWQHWTRARRQGAAGYVRSGALRRAHARSRTRGYQRSAGVNAQQRVTLRALQQVPVEARTAVVLACLGDLSATDVAQQLGETRTGAEELLEQGRTVLAAGLSLDPADVGEPLRGLEAAVRAAAQPTPEEVRHQAVRRRRVWLGAGAVAALAVTFLAGALVSVHALPGDQESALASSVSSRMLLTGGDLAPLGGSSAWQVRSTSDNTSGTGINTPCQRERFADRGGVRDLVRRSQLSGHQQRTATQTVELSRTATRSRQAFRTAVGWYAGCRQGSLQLLSTYRVRGLGDEAMVLTFRAQGVPLTSFAVGVARTGRITTWTGVRTPGARNPASGQVVRALQASVTKLCSSRAAGACALDPVAEQDPPPPSGEQPGMLAVADLPAVGDLESTWVGTGAQRPQANPAATTCDHADFSGSGGAGVLSRTFLVPGAPTPSRFGISETMGRFATPARAGAFVALLRGRMDGCARKDPASRITAHASGHRAGSTWSLWRLESKVSDHRTITYWTAVSRVGRDVAQVTFVPGDGARQDITQKTFASLVERSRERLQELG